MKKVFLCFILAAIGFSVSAQDKAAERSERVAQMKLELTKPEVKAATAEMTKLYELTPKQADQMAKVQLRKLKNLADIAPLKESNKMTYFSKLRAIRLGVEASTKRILTSRQMLTFNKLQEDRRIEESKLIKELKVKGLSRTEIRIAVIEKMEAVD